MVLGIDPGRVRTGLALSDETGSIALPLEVVSTKDAIKIIGKIIEERKISVIVVGMPYTLLGEVGPEGKRVEKFIGRLKRIFPEIQIEVSDERLSSLEANHYLSSSKKKAHRDAVAASIMLERYLNSEKKKCS